MAYPFHRRFFNALPSGMRRLMMSVLAGSKLKEMSRIRTEVVNGYSLKESEEMNALFVHVPKNGGTSINKALFKSKGSGHNSYHFFELIYSKTELGKMYKFAFVRNPWSRLYSSYRYLSKGGGNDWDKKWAEENIMRYADFNSFVMEWLSEDRLMDFVHFVPQHFYILDGHGRNHLDFIGRFEHMERHFQEVVSALGVDAQLEHLNASAPQDSYLQAYTEEAKAKVASVYSRDIELFGYNFEPER